MALGRLTVPPLLPALTPPTLVACLGCLAARGGWWNNQWAEFFKRNPRATAKQCEAFLKELIERARIGDIPIK